MAALALEDRVSALEQLLEQGAPVADAMQPTVITVDPTTGAIGAVFPGGVQIPEAASVGYTPETSLGFLDQISGVVRSFLHADRAGITHRARLSCNPDAADSAILDLLAKEGVAFSQVIVSAADGAGGNSGNKVLIDSSSKSSYLQVGGGALSVVGTGTITWPAATPFSNNLNVKLAGAAGTVQALCTAAGAVLNPGFVDFGVVAAQADGAGGVNFTAATRSGVNPGAAGTLLVAYLMWGT